MKLAIEKWIEEQNPPYEAILMMEEAVKCYKGGSYRGAFLFSYLFFQTVIKHRIQNAPIPNHYENEKDWYYNVLEKVNDDDHWDSHVFTFLTTKKEKGDKKNKKEKNDRKEKDDKKIKPIFELKENLITQVNFWKDRRNDCAHFKNNPIEHSHVEAYWLFIRTHLNNFVLIGSMESILQELKENIELGLFQKEVESESNSLIDKVALSVSSGQLNEFSRAILKIFKDNPIISTKGHRFMMQLIKKHSNFCEPWINCLKDDITDTIDFINVDLTNTIFFLKDPTFLRKIWYKNLDKVLEPFKFISNLYNHDVFDDKDLEDVSEKLYTVRFFFSPKIHHNDHYTLEQIGYWKHFREHMYEHIHGFIWSNSESNISKVLLYLEHNDLDKDLVGKIELTFSSEYYPYNMQPELKNFFEKNLIKRKQYLHLFLEKYIKEDPGVILRNKRISPTENILGKLTDEEEVLLDKEVAFLIEHYQIESKNKPK